MRKLAVLAFIAFLPLGASAARLTLRDGTMLDGSFISGTQRTIIFQDNHGVRRRFDVNQIQNIDFNSFSAPAATSGLQNNNTYRNDNVFRGDNTYQNKTADRIDRSAGYHQRIVTAALPAGTEIAVRNNEEINSETATQGRTYTAQVERDVHDSNGNVVIPRGSNAELVIRSFDQGGRLSNGNLALDLDTITVEGRRYRVSTEDVQRSNQSGIGKNTRTAEMVGGGAVLGTLLGAIAGGGKGAAIGALAGGTAGAGVQVLTKGDRIRVPAETVLNFRLDQPLRLREYQ